MLVIILIVVLYLFFSYTNKIIEQQKINNIGQKFIFWTGGFDSTFRLLQLCENKILVQPIYLYGNVDSDIMFIQRQNKLQELTRMIKIRKLINDMYPWTRRTLMGTLFVSDIPKNKFISDKYSDLYTNLGFFSRPSGQLRTMATLSYLHKIIIETGIEDCVNDKTFPICNLLVGNNDNRRIKTNLPEEYKDLVIFKYLRFPIAHLTKQEMLDICREKNWKDIIKTTFSCWFPSFGEPCGTCDMCRKRIV